MCLAVPGLIESVDGRTAIVDFGGVKREAIIDLMEPGSIKARCICSRAHGFRYPDHGKARGT